MAPLQKIYMANCDLLSIPDFGILPDLIYLNVSFNQFEDLKPQEFSPFCKLGTLVINNSTKNIPCTCKKTLQTYFDRRLIILNDSLDCTTDHEGTDIYLFHFNFHFSFI